MIFFGLGTSSIEEVCVSSGLQSYLGVLMFSMVLHGIGGTTLYTVGVGLLDDSVPATSSPLYLGICVNVFFIITQQTHNLNP